MTHLQKDREREREKIRWESERRSEGLNEKGLSDEQKEMIRRGDDGRWMKRASTCIRESDD